MIGDKVKLGGFWVMTTLEEKGYSCNGCCFQQEVDDNTKCVITEEVNLKCGEHNSIYKMSKVEKGIKRKLTTN